MVNSIRNRLACFMLIRLRRHMNILLIIYYYFIAMFLVYYSKHAWPKYCPAFALHGVLEPKTWLKLEKSDKGDARDDIYHQDFFFIFHLDLFVRILGYYGVLSGSSAYGAFPRK